MIHYPVQIIPPRILLQPSPLKVTPFCIDLEPAVLGVIPCALLIISSLQQQVPATLHSMPAMVESKAGTLSGHTGDVAGDAVGKANDAVVQPDDASEEPDNAREVSDDASEDPDDACHVPPDSFCHARDPSDHTARAIYPAPDTTFLLNEPISLLLNIELLQLDLDAQSRHSDEQSHAARKRAAKAGESSGDSLEKPESIAESSSVTREREGATSGESDCSFRSQDDLGKLLAAFAGNAARASS